MESHHLKSQLSQLLRGNWIAEVLSAILYCISWLQWRKTKQSEQWKLENEVQVGTAKWMEPVPIRDCFTSVVASTYCYRDEKEKSAAVLFVCCAGSSWCPVSNWKLQLTDFLHWGLNEDNVHGFTEAWCRSSFLSPAKPSTDSLFSVLLAMSKNRISGPIQGFSTSSGDSQTTAQFG